MKKILFDLFSAQPVGSSKFHGGGEYIKKILMTLIREYNQKCSLFVFYDFDKFLDDYLKEALDQYGVVSYNIKKYSDLEKIFGNEYFDVFYSGVPYFYGEIKFPETLSCVATFHGLRVLEKYTDPIENMYYSGLMTLKPTLKRLLSGIRMKNIYSMYKSSLFKFSNVICDSLHSKYAIEYYFPEYGRDKVEVMYALTKNSDEAKDENEAGFPDLGKYILIIGLNRWEKNGVRGVWAVDRIFSRGLLADYKVIVLGKIPPKAMRKLKKPERIIQMGYVDSDYMEKLYQHCDIFLYPTLNEGFGVPPCEVMRYGKTCVVGAVCSLPEIYGDAVYYVNPYDINEIASRVIMASEIKIDKDKVLDQYKKISLRQDHDLMRICEFIIRGGLHE